MHYVITMHSGFYCSVLSTEKMCRAVLLGNLVEENPYNRVTGNSTLSAPRKGNFLPIGLLC